MIYLLEMRIKEVKYLKKLYIRKLEELKTTAPGGVPALHELSGRDWGQAVSALAKSSPAAVAIHKGVGPQ